MNRVVVPVWIKWFFPQLIWEVPTKTKDIYLTFDDGPTPGVTPQVLALLLEYNAKATFFCLGSKVKDNPQLANEIRMNGHVIGNHGYNHISGLTTSFKKYFANTKLGEQYTGSRLFRPPYGRITPWQIRNLKKEYKIIMWGIMSMDFDRHTSPEQCLKNVTDNIKPGAIVVFHDTEKAQDNVLKVLPEMLKWLKAKGYTTKTFDL